MDVAAQVHLLYEEHPYPAMTKQSRASPVWRLPPMEWIDSIWQPVQPVPERILVAGCGTGMEAFALSRRFPSAEIVAVDFSARSIALARRVQKRAPKFRQIRFVVGDLTRPNFVKAVGSAFDFISCHGVLSYIAHPGAVLRNFVRALAPRGLLYLGVNGSAHFSVKWRSALPGFGFKITRFEDGRRLRQVLNFCDAVAESPGGSVAGRDPAYLAGDLFGPLIHNLPLADWIAHGRGAGLSFRSSYSAQRPLRSALTNEACRLLFPRSRAEVCQMVETLRPSAFHGLLFASDPAENPPWENRRELLRWRVIRTRLYGNSWPKRRAGWRALRRVRLKSAAINSQLELRVPEWGVEILRQSDGAHSLGEILNRIPLPVSSASLCSSLYLLYQLALINVLPPRPRGRQAQMHSAR